MMFIEEAMAPRKVTSMTRKVSNIIYKWCSLTMEKTEMIVKKNAKKAWHFHLRLVLMTIIMVDGMVDHKGVQVMGDALIYQQYG